MMKLPELVCAAVDRALHHVIVSEVCAADIADHLGLPADRRRIGASCTCSTPIYLDATDAHLLGRRGERRHDRAAVPMLPRHAAAAVAAEGERRARIQPHTLGWQPIEHGRTTIMAEHLEPFGVPTSIGIHLADEGQAAYQVHPAPHRADTPKRCGDALAQAKAG